MTQLNSDSYRNPLRYQGQDYAYVPLYYRQRNPTTTDLRPKEQTGFYLIGSEWMNTITGDYWYLSSLSTLAGVLQANWVLFGGATGDLLTLTDNAGTITTPDINGNIQIAGQIGEKNGTPFNTTTSGTHKITINPMATARLIVDQNAGNGTNTTIMGAMALARSGDTIFILPGTYIENVDMLSGVSLAAYSCDGINGNVVIQGRVRLAGNGTCSFAGIQFKTNGNYAIELTGNATMNFVDCNIVANDFTAIHVNNALGQINLDQCIGGNAGANAFFAVDLGVLEITDCFLGNSSNTATTCTCAGTFNSIASHFDYALTTSGTGSVNYYFSRMHTAAFNGVALTLVGTGGATIENCVFQTGSGIAVTVGAGCNCNFQNNVVDSTAANSITGAGSINYANNSFVNSSFISTTTQSPNTLRYGFASSTLQPSFRATLVNALIGVTGDGTVYNVLFDTVNFSQSSTFNTGTGTYTYPLTGKYQVNVTIGFSGIAVGHTNLLMQLVSSGNAVQLFNINPSAISPGGVFVCSGSIIVSAAANDTALVQVQVSGAAKAVNLQANAAGSFCNFSAVLVC